MSYEEKGAWVYIVVVVGTYVAYVATILSRAGGEPLSDVDFRGPMLWSIAISIGLSIVGRILVEIARPSERHKLDVRDRDINRFSEYVSGTVLGFAMIGPFLLAVFDADNFWIANAIYAAFALSAVVGTTIKLLAYRRGL